jgi:hypothetical protein
MELGIFTYIFGEALGMYDDEAIAAASGIAATIR